MPTFRWLYKQNYWSGLIKESKFETPTRITTITKVHNKLLLLNLTDLYTACRANQNLFTLITPEIHAFQA